MNSICEDCYSNIEQYGHPCCAVALMVVSNYLKGRMTIFPDDPEIEFNEFISPIKYLEEKGLMLSCEISINEIAVIPNCSFAIFKASTRQLCWCGMPLNKISW